MILKAIALAVVTQQPLGGPVDLTAFTTSLPKTVGEVRITGLSAPVRIARDEIGVPEITGTDLYDVIRAQGFVHGQERFFQMDMLRRLSSGRLAAVIGARGVQSDRSYRALRALRVADEVVRRQPDDTRRMLEVYAEGVNAGLAALDAAPPEYAFVGVEPEAWFPRDTVLTLLTMCDTLNWNQRIEYQIHVMRAALPDELMRFMLPERTRFDSPLLPGAGEPEWTPLAVPGPDVVDLRGRTRADVPHDFIDAQPPFLGSNNWAVDGSRSVHGGAILANDPHLQITAPGVWYRVELAWDGGCAMGLSLPGSPGVLIGSNTHIAWGFTNTQGDFQDWILVDRDPENLRNYLTPEGSEPYRREVEVIEVAGGQPIQHTLRMTRWGPITKVDHDGREFVLKWTALDPETLNMGILRMMSAETLERGVEVARTWYGPSQNILIADAGGRIAWAVSGYFPKRVGFDGTAPVSWARAGVGWDGPLDESLRPVVIDPPEGILYTANNRTVDVEWARTLGNGWTLGARAHRIAELLRSRSKLDEHDLRAIQLDTRVAVFDFYRDLAVEVMSGTDDPLFAEARLVLAGWNGRADADQAGIRILHLYREHLYEQITAALIAPCLGVDPFFRYRWARSEESVRRVLETRPAHLCPPGYQDWDSFLRNRLSNVLEILVAKTPLERLTAGWGKVNPARVRHPMSDVAGSLASMLNMRPAAQPGHPYAIRVATPSYGASCRMVVSPGREDEGLLHIPAGQSGHPLSPHYRDSHPAWLEGRSTPFRAGDAVETLTLVPAGG